jgi:tetratricopeptide (TPR) repeat protein
VPEARTPGAQGADRVEAVPTLTAVTETPGQVLVAHEASELVIVPEDTYALGPELGSGGSARVFLARDRRLGREVALKVLQRTEPIAVERFLREGRITARLQHPSIVPLHEMGRLSTGEPFLAMKRSPGLPLDQAIAAASDLDGRLSLVPRVLAACNAVAYAHAAGVIHRDLKPSNVLLGDFDETLVADWGLAKELGSGARDEPGPGDPERNGESGTSGDLTFAGGAIGTPAYMPPEQARGEPADARSDVWALGAMLHHVVSGTPPHAGESAAEILARVCEGPPPPLRAKSPACPAELASIVDRALAYAPEDRYPDASSLADELRAYLAGQRVRAHAYTPRELVSHWLRRHRTLVRVGALSLACLLAIGAFSIWRIVGEKRRADALRVVAETRREAAEQLVQFVVFKLRDDLQSLGRLDLLASAGQRVEDYYERLQSVDASPGADARLRAAAALELLGDVARDRGDHAKVLPLQRRALQLRESVLAESPEDAARLEAVSGSWSRIAQAEAVLGHTDQAAQAGQRALELAIRASDRRPDDVSLQSNVYRVAAHASTILYRRGETDEALRVLRLARDRLAQLVERHPSDDARSELAAAELRLGNMLEYLKRLDEAHESTTRAVELWRGLASRRPDDAPTLVVFAGALHVASRVESARGEWGAARPLLDEAVAVRERLSAGDPVNRIWRDSFASTLADRCQLFADHGEPARGLPDCARSVEIYRGLTREQPENDTWREGLVRSLSELSDVQRRAGKTAEARATSVESIEQVRPLLARGRRDAVIRQMWIVAHARAAEAERVSSPAQARQRLQTALEEVRALRAEQPTNARRRHDEADLVLSRAELDLLLHDLGATQAALDEARAALEPDRTTTTQMGLELPVLRARVALLAHGLAAAQGHPSSVEAELAAALQELSPLRSRLDAEDVTVLARLEQLARTGKPRSPRP